MTVRPAPAPLPDVRADAAGPFGIYVHVPFCATRCGYCDFNTYTPAELGGANPDGWLAALQVELELAAGHMGDAAAGTDGVRRRRDAVAARWRRAQLRCSPPSATTSSWLPTPR